MKLPATLILDDVSRTNPYRQMEIDNNLRISSIRCFDARQEKRNFLCARACVTRSIKSSIRRLVSSEEKKRKRKKEMREQGYRGES